MSDLPSPPFVHIEGIHNFRDIGGYPVATGEIKGLNEVRRHYIYRCAEPSKVTREGEEHLLMLGITTIYDLRSQPEIENMQENNPVVEIKGIARVFAPVFAERDSSPEQVAIRYQAYASRQADGFSRAYDDILASAAPSYRQMFTHIRDKPNEPFVVHCTAGKDRTGVFVALVLGLAGADAETIAKEYEYTEAGLAPLIPHFMERISKEPHFTDNEEGARNLLSSK